MDEGGTERVIQLIFDSNVTTQSISVGTLEISIFTPGTTTYKTYQFKIQDILDKAGVGWVLTQLTKIKYATQLKTGASITLGGEWGSTSYFQNALVSPSKVYVHTDKVENLVGRTFDDDAGNPQGNDATITFPEGYGDVINVYGQDVDKICSVTRSGENLLHFIGISPDQGTAKMTGAAIGVGGAVAGAAIGVKRASGPGYRVHKGYTIPVKGKDFRGVIGLPANAPPEVILKTHKLNPKATIQIDSRKIKPEDWYIREV